MKNHWQWALTTGSNLNRSVNSVPQINLEIHSAKRRVVHHHHGTKCF